MQTMHFNAAIYNRRWFAALIIYNDVHKDKSVEERLGATFNRWNVRISHKMTCH